MPILLFFVAAFLGDTGNPPFWLIFALFLGVLGGCVGTFIRRKPKLTEKQDANIVSDPFSASDAAALIGGMTQATKYLGVEWEGLPEEQRSQMIEDWRRIIEGRPADVPAEVIASIARHPALAEAWQKLGSYAHESRSSYIRAIVRNTVPVACPDSKGQQLE